jgi:hypothetical protein
MSLYIVSIALSAFLIFQIQPVIARTILPWFGGTPAVWSTVMMFFQVMLTGGYAYAYWLAERVRPRRQGAVHLALIAVTLAIFGALAMVWPSPITPGLDWKPTSVDAPVARIFLLLLVAVGLPYFTLSTNSTLIQSWFNRKFPGRSPYWLYALSNLSSLLGLLTYPFLVEPYLTLRQQGWVWSAGYVLFALLTIWMAARIWKDAPRADPQTHVETVTPAVKPSVSMQVLWVLLSACASVLLLAVTSQITQEVAVIPFLWILPLALYLLTFILAFSGTRLYRRPVFVLLLELASLGLIFVLVSPQQNLFLQLGLYLLFLFACCMSAHGELYALRPAPAYLPRFYLMVSAGGALGGISVNLLAPSLFRGYWELYIGWVALLILLSALTFIRPTVELQKTKRFLHDVSLGIFALLAFAFSWLLLSNSSSLDSLTERNFYGVLHVRFDSKSNANLLLHGVTLHGFQFIAPEERWIPTSYYWKGSGIGLAIVNHPRYGHALKVGVLGLGIGTIAAYGQPGDSYRFYEINPLVVDLAEGQGGYFSFLKGSKANVDVVLGDARISLEQEQAAGQLQNFDILALDTFSSDSIPVHLITREAFAVYLAHLAPDGVIAAHISNRHVDLKPVLWQIAQEFGLHIALLDIPAPADDPSAATSLWMLLTRDPAFLQIPAIAAHADTLDGFTTDIRLWTDDYSNLFQVLK